jgi:oxygen-dependent protoporphyrinogen oxidase
MTAPGDRVAGEHSRSGLGPGPDRSGDAHPVVVVVGGGVAGLAAAEALLDTVDRAHIEVRLYEATSRVGGKLRSIDFADRRLDVGPDAFLARRPEAVDLARRVGLGDELRAPATGRAWIATGRRLVPLPDGLVLGVPTSLGPLVRSPLVGPIGAARAALDEVLPRQPPVRPIAIGALTRARLGRRVTEMLVEPLLGGINAGRIDELDTETVAPQLWAAAQRPGGLMAALREARRPASTPTPPESEAGSERRPDPTFFGLEAGLERLPATLAGRLVARGLRVELDRTVEALAAVRPGDPTSALWLTSRRADGRPVVEEVAGVVVATPAPAAARLLAEVAPESAARLAGIPYAGVAVATLRYPPGAVARPLDGSGVLVPRPEGRLMTACTWSSVKWPHLSRSGDTVLRVSAGHAGDLRPEGEDDETLLRRLRLEVAELFPFLRPPSDALLTRWPAAFPQYLPGHRDRVEAIRAALPPTVQVAGAALDGVGIPACVASGARAGRLLAGGVLAGG